MPALGISFVNKVSEILIHGTRERSRMIRAYERRGCGAFGLTVPEGADRASRDSADGLDAHGRILRDLGRSAAFIDERVELAARENSRDSIWR
jgi:hypothetical protein